MSKERAVRRAEREREAAAKAAAHARKAERRERRSSRAKAVKSATSRRLPSLSPVGRHTGTLARRRQLENWALTSALLVLNVVVWVVRPDWSARLGALVISVLLFPVLRTLMFPR